MDDLPGLDLHRLTRWLAAQHPELLAGKLTGAVLSGGRSNLTYRVGDGVSTWALRRPPLAHVLATAHDMAREFRVISALATTDVPVAAPVAFCEDDRVIGAPFYLMSFVEGVVPDNQGSLAHLSPDRARLISQLLIDTLAGLHSVDAHEVGLGDLGRPDGFLARQLRRWAAQWQANETTPRPVLDDVCAALLRTIPTQSAPGLVHGDYRLQNLMFTPDFDAVAAVVDWEMATLGDPLTDLGLLVVYQALADRGELSMPRMPAGDGFLGAEQLTARYGAASERDLADLGWYVAFGYFKLAVILEGIHHRFLQGKTVGDGFEQFGPAVPELLDNALHILLGRGARR